MVKKAETIKMLRRELRKNLRDVAEEVYTDPYDLGFVDGAVFATVSALEVLDPSYNIESDTLIVCAAPDCNRFFFPCRKRHIYHSASCRSRINARRFRSKPQGELDTI